MASSIKRRLNVGFAFAILVVLVISAISFITFKKQYLEGELVKHTYQVINQLQAIQNTLIDMETGRRGFRSTNDKTFLRPYKEGLIQIDDRVQNLQRLIKDNPTQTARSEKAKAYIADLLLFWKGLGEDASKYTRERIAEIMSEEKLKMDKIAVQLSEMVIDETRLLKKRELDNRASVTLAETGLVIGIILILSIVIILIIQILSEFKNRQKAEEDLQNNFKELSLVNQQNTERNWLLNGLAKVNNILQGHLSVAPLSQVALDTIVKYINLQAGAFYIYSNEHKTLVLSASYALPDNAKKEYSLQEGFVGQAAMEKEPVIITNIPPGYATITGGSVKIEPINAVYASLLHNDELIGVIEVLSFSPVGKETLQLLKLISNNIAVAMHAVQEREKVHQLLEEVQRQKEVVEQQQEELRQSNEELMVQAEVLQTSEEELRVQEEELRQINAELKQKNITIEKAGQSLERKALELEESSKYKSEFLANMSHELRTPLNSVLILGKLLAENKDLNLTEKQVSHAKIIYKSGSDLLQLINDILDLSKIEAGKADLHFDNVSVAGIALDMEQMFSVVADEKGINFTIKIEDGTIEKINTDKQKVEQVLKNLLSNAFKFTSTQGVVSLHFKQIVEGGTEYIVASVSDTGIGIPASKQQVIFEAFQQADGSTNRKFGGTGLGLSITKELVRILKGSIRLQSREGSGSTFIVNIPLEAKPLNGVLSDRAEDTAESQGNELEQKIIADDRNLFLKEEKVMLIIEDDKDFARLLKEFANANGFKSIVALTGDEGLFCAIKYRPSAIILDMNLPGINGLTLLKSFKEDEGLKHIPVHVISASDNINALASGALAYLKKPIEKAELDNVFSLISEYLNATVKRVLIFSKNDLQNEIIDALSLEKNFEIVCDTAATIEEGWDKLDKVNYDCIIADIGSNIEDGVSKLSALNAHLMPQHIPTIIYVDRDISTADELDMKKIADVVVRKSSFSNKRLLDELELFLYKVQEKKNVRQLAINKQVNFDVTLQNKKVLLVDDDMRNIFALSAALESHQMQVLTASDGKEAIDILNNDRTIDIVLMDVMMPEMDGYEAISTIRNKMKLTGLPIIALTAKAMVGDREKCLSVGASDYISKPVDVHKLASLMRVWLS